MYDEKNIFPKSIYELVTPQDHIGDIAVFSAMNTHALVGMYAVEFGNSAECVEQKDLNICSAAQKALQATLELVPLDSNEGLTGWVGYESANAACDDCSYSCSIKTYWKNGYPKERARASFYKPPEEILKFTIDLTKYYGRSSEVD